MPNVYIALGSNLSSVAGAPLQTLTHSLKLFKGESLEIVAQSNWFASAAFPAGTGPDYVNGVVAVQSPLAPSEILAALHRIETTLGRQRKARWGARVCDLDLLAVGAQILPDLAGFSHWFDLALEQQKATAPQRLILPHPRLQDRGFVLVPFAQIAPLWCHPVTGKTVQEMLAQLPLGVIEAVQPIT